MYKLIAISPAAGHYESNPLFAVESPYVPRIGEDWRPRSGPLEFVRVEGIVWIDGIVAATNPGEVILIVSESHPVIVNPIIPEQGG